MGAIFARLAVLALIGGSAIPYIADGEKTQKSGTKW